MAQDRLQVHVQAVAIAQELQEMAGAGGAARVVDQLPGRGEAIWQNLKLLALWRQSANGIMAGKKKNLQTAKVPFIFKLRFSEGQIIIFLSPSELSKDREYQTQGGLRSCSLAQHKRPLQMRPQHFNVANEAGGDGAKHQGTVL